MRASRSYWLALAIGAALLGCESPEMTPRDAEGPQHPTSGSSGEQIRVVAIGDSNTYDGRLGILSYPNLSRWIVYNGGVPGSTARSWVGSGIFDEHVADKHQSYGFQICSIMLGGNDARKWHPVADYREDIEELISRCRALGIERVILHGVLGTLLEQRLERKAEYTDVLRAIVAADTTGTIRFGQDMEALRQAGLFTDWVDDSHLGQGDHERLAPLTDTDFEWLD